MRNRRYMYLFLSLALVLIVTSLVVEPRWLQIVLTGLSAGSGALFLSSFVARQDDPNGPRGQH